MQPDDQPGQHLAVREPGARQVHVLLQRRRARGGGHEGHPDAVELGRSTLSLCRMATYHVTTFGCQMNEHDSERMKGMLESLGYEEAAERDDADLILFNTCSIRESADNRFIAHLGEAKRLKSEDPSRVVGVGGCWSQSVKDEVFERFPFVDVAFGPGPDRQARRVPDPGLAHGAGLLRVRGLLRAPAGEARARVPGLGADLGRLQLRLLVLHRPPDARARGQPRPRRAGRRGRGARRRRRARGDAARPERQLLRPRPAARASGSTSPSCWRRVDAVDGIERIRYTSPHPKDMREDVIRAHAELPRSASTSTCRCSRARAGS